MKNNDNMVVKCKSVEALNKMDQFNVEIGEIDVEMSDLSLGTLQHSEADVNQEPMTKSHDLSINSTNHSAKSQNGTPIEESNIEAANDLADTLFD